VDYEGWCAIPGVELARRDVAEINLAAASGLPGAEDLDISACVRRLDEGAERVRQATCGWWPMFVAAPGDYEGSAAQFRMMALVTVLQLHLGVRYDPASISGVYDARDARRHFIHGPLSGEGGTCSSLPVLYLAVGRRLGYPLALVQAKEHFFIRWEEPHERFNIECTMIGFEPRADDYYRTWPFPISDQELARGYYLTSMTPREELACFIQQRGKCWLDHLKLPRAVEAFQYAARLDGRYRGDLAVGLTVYRTLDRIMRGCASGGLELSEMIERAAPRACTPSERWALTHAKAELLRILKNQSEVARASGRNCVSVCL
jgi:hypothetical protein